MESFPDRDMENPNNLKATVCYFFQIFLVEAPSKHNNDTDAYFPTSFSCWL